MPGVRVPTTGARRFGDTRETHTHAGVDLAAPNGTPVLAPEAGTVLTVAQHGARGFRAYTPAVLLAGDSGRFHLLAHLSGGVSVAEGARVVLGQQLGAIGAPEHHTHWEIRTTRGPLSGSSTREETRTIAHVLAPAEWLEGRDVTFDGTAAPPSGRIPEFFSPRPSSSAPPNFFFRPRPRVIGRTERSCSCSSVSRSRALRRAER